jgi:putative colanic acid biosynthesis acetyltransferase WcaF
MSVPTTSTRVRSGGNRFELGGFTGAGYDRGRSVAIQILWLLVSRSVLFRWWMPNRVRISVLRLFGARIGTGTLIRHDVKVHWPWKLTIGDNSWIGEETWILNLEPVTIGSNSCISQGVLLCTGSHDRFSPTFEFDNGPIEIGDHVWVAARATVLRGIRIDNGCTIAATAVVTRDVLRDRTVYAPQASHRGNR